jgi:hypothetical protein
MKNRYKIIYSSSFLMVWIAGFCLISQCVYFAYPGRQPIGFYICRGHIPVSDLDQPEKLRTGIMVLAVISILLSLLLLARIECYKYKHIRNDPGEG